ncbi:DUF421 domain-containing protein [Alkaliphilus peptidifermentans]|uniref:Uncharacterized membrane protein YcaP, DUF421 family n=1 Tax=Alkaliphilus peptidifermentans DSM 18978 TaxID=1120976 RepID=A0A1G5JVK5_9FIRM|nr:DUF421 domain-containing protein [Alkaliphilus peptidifermentans]SCY92482.1 Uncharacterized membrane protein YcaP, DUF421 family [Alkaliphilus peptidifermentans DSM 18978]
MEPWIQLTLRVLGLFLLLVLVLPILGRKPVSGMTFFDLISGFVIATMISLIAFNIVGNLAMGVSGLLIWFLALGVVRFLIQKSKWAHDHFYGKEIVIIKEGKVLEENLHSTGITGEELLSQLRRKSIFQLADVEFAVMEANGDISVLPKHEKQPLTPKDMRIQVSTISEPQIVVLDGNILDEPLNTLGLNRRWLQTEIEKMGIATDNIFLAQVDSMGELYVDLFDDAIQLPMPTTKELLIATLNKVEADFISFSLETENKEWQKKYKHMAKEIKEVTDKLEPHLKT